jgi:hypothetical protein
MLQKSIRKFLAVAALFALSGAMLFQAAQSPSALVADGSGQTTRPTGGG